MQTGYLLDERYQILNKLGEGTFGETYKATDQKKPSKPFCVVKRLKPAHTNQLVRDFFNKEAAVLERLGKHDQIPDLLAHFMIDPDLFIVQEFVEGHSLRQEIRPGWQSGESYVTKLLQDLLEILAFVHQNGVIHRDIKPENVMRRADGKLVLIDFGVVKQLGSVVVSSSGNIQTSVVAGTQGYMPIEQFRGKPGCYSDVYALGMMAIEALTGIYPTELPDDPQTGDLLWRDRVQVSDRLAQVINTMVQERYSHRYPSAIEALQAIQSVVNPPLSSPTPPSSPAPAPTPVIAPPSASIPTPSISPSSPSPHPLHPNWSRRKLIKTAGWLSLGVGGVSAIALRQRFLEAEQSVTVNERGEIISRRSVQAQSFTQNLDNGVTLELVQIPGGRFLMGSPESEKDRENRESPQHEVNVPAFFMGKFAVTQAQYEAVMGNNPARFKGANRPVENVSWNEAIEFCQKLSQQTGRIYRLPSEAEWEYACRAETTTPFHFGETITSNLANYLGTEVYQSEPAGEFREQTTDVGSFPPNAFGLYDMHGNVWEWCQDIWHGNYNGAPTDGSAWVIGGEGDQRVLRGGSWYDTPGNCRSASRGFTDPDAASATFGYRVVCVAPRTL